MSYWIILYLTTTKLATYFSQVRQIDYFITTTQMLFFQLSKSIYMYFIGCRIHTKRPITGSLVLYRGVYFNRAWALLRFPNILVVIKHDL